MRLLKIRNRARAEISGADSENGSSSSWLSHWSAPSLLCEGGVHLALNLWLLRGLGHALHVVWSFPHHSAIALVINHHLILGDHVAEDEVGGLVVVGLLLQLLALGKEGVHLGELGLCGLLLEALFLLLVLDLLSSSSPDTLKQVVM